MKSICLTASEITQILKGEKTQCRKVVKPQPEGNLYKTTLLKSDGYRLYSWFNGQYVTELYVSYKIGETIYCKEPWTEEYEISNSGLLSTGYKLHHAITMPEWASRCKIRITDIKCERLRDISEDDAIAEGITQGGCLNCGNPQPCGCDKPSPCYAESYLYEWAKKHSKTFNKIYDEGFSQWVWVYTFEKVEGE